ncbi:UDP-N-acetylglucosamine:alpha-6-D-mannoside beta-1,2-N-acetylglucosaminyltransferase II [Danaus plexippus plexippus]|uniref:UDP-N-acetylglucosamine:alpha-6-D-mannoside beta-1,2-N-acetylglucosaminyltransferase II n=1 Tax=Danaus plexippus plexippus TaxID=278856 RepID=A0A212FHB7_DANPL|nr:UDP-N-acetylglucosamine:alpha-6-D-mannoside beta-1,2-N-acetylglucosaminyltransferase II [Danaus plexippus plexippus]
MPRIRYASFLRVVVIAGLFCVWVQIMLAATNGAMDKDAEELMNSNDTSEQVLALVPPELHKYLTVHSKNTTGNSTERYGPKNITEMRRAIDRMNDAQTIYNEDIFGPVQNDTIIIAIQVSAAGE